jgi:hypothetical protein
VQLLNQKFWDLVVDERMRILMNMYPARMLNEVCNTLCQLTILVDFDHKIALLYNYDYQEQPPVEYIHGETIRRLQYSRGWFVRIELEICT